MSRFNSIPAAQQIPLPSSCIVLALSPTNPCFMANIYNIAVPAVTSTVNEGSTALVVYDLEDLNSSH